MIKVYAKVGFIFLTLLMIQRIEYLLFFYENWKTNTFQELAFCLFAGLRFDVMVGAYSLLPILLFIFPMSQKVISELKLTDAAIKGYGVLLILILGIIAFVDMQWAHVFADRFNQQHSIDQFLLAQKLDVFLILNLFLLMVTLILFLKRMLSLHISIASKLSYKSWLFLLLMSVIMIRGSFDEHHLDLRHSRVTGSDFLNNASISSAYALDQALRQRR